MNGWLNVRMNTEVTDWVNERINKCMTEWLMELMNDIQFELAAEYLVMAAVLAEIKSRMLLPRQAQDEQDDDDPQTFWLYWADADGVDSGS